MKCSKEKLLAFHFFCDLSARKAFLSGFIFYHQQTDQAYIFNFGSNGGLFFKHINKPYMFLSNISCIFDAALDAGHKYTATDKARGEWGMLGCGLG